MWQELQIFAFVCTYWDAGWVFLDFAGSDFGITAVDDITNGITWAVFCFDIAHISFANSWYLFCLSVIVTIIILGISFMQGIYTYIPETNHVPREHCVAAILV